MYLIYNNNVFPIKKLVNNNNKINTINLGISFDRTNYNYTYINDWIEKFHIKRNIYIDYGRNHVLYLNGCTICDKISEGDIIINVDFFSYRNDIKFKSQIRDFKINNILND